MFNDSSDEALYVTVIEFYLEVSLFYNDLLKFCDLLKSVSELELFKLSTEYKSTPSRFLALIVKCNQTS